MSKPISYIKKDLEEKIAFEEKHNRPEHLELLKAAKELLQTYMDKTNPFFF